MIITGAPFTTSILSRLRISIDKIKPILNRHPKLAIIQVGSHSSSNIFVKNKIRVAKDLNIDT